MVVHHTEMEGLVLVDRNTVATSLGDVSLSFGAYPADTVARIRFLHPLHNFALLSYKTADLPPEVSPQLSPQLACLCSGAAAGQVCAQQCRAACCRMPA